MVLFLFLLLLLLLPFALAAPSHADTVHLPLRRRGPAPEQRIANLPKIMDAIRLKYGFKPVNQKRSTTTSSLTDEGNDSSYSAVVAIGSPAQQLNLILDTGKPSPRPVIRTPLIPTQVLLIYGSLLLNVPLNESSSLQITYGSGQVSGYVSQDTVTFSDFTMSNQQLLSVSSTSSDLIDDQLSGIMGLGFETLSMLQTPPFWQTLLGQNKLSSPVFSFYLERYVNQNEIDEAPGGVFTLGGTNTSLYSGNIEFIDMPSGTTPSYWLQQIQSVTVQGNSISISNNEGLAAIDTGTTLIGAPSDITKQIWSNVHGAVALTGEYQGMWAFPCSTSVSVSISFGGTSWNINTADMNLGSISGSGTNQMCGGGIFDIGSTVGSGPGTPAWIVGDTFLKNVYTVFQGTPPAVGFAQLASGLSDDTASASNPISITGSAGIPVPSESGSPLFGSAASPRMIVSTTSSFVAAILSALLITLSPHGLVL